MSRPTDWSALDLDKDPVPGDPYDVKALAKTLHDFADDVGTALRSIRGLAGDSALLDWVGLSGDAFRQQYGDLPKDLDKLESSYRMAGTALATYWPQLEHAQSQADKALSDARDAKQQLATANSQLSTANDWVNRANTESQKYQQTSGTHAPPPDPDKVKAAARNATQAGQAHTTAQNSVHTAQDKLDAAKQLAGQATQLRDHAATTAAHALDDASDAGIQNKHWWQKAVDWVADHWDDIVAVCKVIVAVLGIVVMIIGGPLAWLVVAAALLVLADTVNKYLHGKASLWDVAFAALDCIPMTKGLTTAGGLLKMAREAPALLRSGETLERTANALRKGGQALKDAMPSLRRGTEDEAKAGKDMAGRCKGGDPVDLITGQMLMSQVDLELAGLLPLTIERHHVSGYRGGYWFGPSWASTLDERLEADGDGIVCGAADGMLQVYPVPRAGREVLPSQGPQRPLTWDGTRSGEIRIVDPVTGGTRHYAPLSQVAHNGRIILPLRAVSDRNGHRIEIDRTEEGVPTAVRHSGGYHVAIDTVGDRVTGLRLLDTSDGAPGGTGTLLRTYGYDDDGNLEHVADSSGGALRLTYDERRRITSWTDRNGYWYRYEYDGSTERVVRGTGPDGCLSAVFGYDGDRRVNTMTNSLGHRTEYHYDESYHLTRTVDPLGGTVLTEYDAHGRLLARTDELGHTARFSYDRHGDLIRMDRQDGGCVSVVYDGSRLPVEVTDAAGAVYRHSYDERGNLLAGIDPLGAADRYTYDEAGRRVTHTDALGNTTRYETDGAGLTVAVIDPLGRSVRLRRDAFGRVTAIEDAAGGTVRQGWNAEGKLTWRVTADGGHEEWLYDGEGNLTTHQNAVGGTTVYEYGPFDLPRWRTDPDGTRYEFTHDTELRLTAVTNPQGQVWRYRFDETGCLTEETDFNGRTLTYVSDAAGRLTQRTNGVGQTVRLARDTQGRVVESRTGDGAATVLAYDLVGRLVSAANPDSVLEYSYDAVGRVLTESVDGLAVSNTYDLLGRRVRRTTPSGAVSDWAYDASSLPTALTTTGGALTFEFDRNGREVARSIGDGALLTQSWDDGHRLSSQTIWATSAAGAGEAAAQERRRLQERTYVWRADGHLTETADQHDGVRRFDLDPAGRVTAVRAATWTESYAYDTLGNLTEADLPGDEGAPERGGHESSGTLIRRAGRTGYEHDGQGRLIRTIRHTLSGQRGEWRYDWDAEDRLTRVVTPDGAVWRYRYDALGRRVAKQRLDLDGNTVEETRFTWDGTNLAEQRTALADGVQAITWDWEPGTHRPASQLNRSWKAADGRQDEVDHRFYAIVTDMIGTPSELVSPDGRIAWRSSTTLWGRPRTADDRELLCPLRFPGQYHDAETGLDYNLARYYDSATGRFLSPDPLGREPAPNHHSYVDNPLSWSDPLGLTGEPQRIYDDSTYDKHSSSASSSAKGEIGRAPADGQAALDRSMPRTTGNDAAFRRIGVDHANQEIVVLDRHDFVTDKDGNIVKEIYHGHVQAKYPSKAVTQAHLTQLKKAGMIDNIKKQRVLPPPCEK